MTKPDMTSKPFIPNRRMARAAVYRLGQISVALATILATVAPAAGAMMCLPEFSNQLDAALAEPPFDRSYVGVLLQTQATEERERQTLYVRHGHQFFTPASNAKLLTTAAALHHLGPDYRIRTSVYGSPGPGGRTDLRVVGRGDPTMTDSQLASLAQQLALGGITRVNQLVLQDAYFPRLATNPTWEWGDAQWDYAAPINSLILNQNAVTVQVAPTQVGLPLSILWPQGFQAKHWPIQNDTATVAASEDAIPVSLWRTGGDDRIQASGQLSQNASPVSFDLAVLNPAQHFAVALRGALERQGIGVAQTVITHTDWPHSGPELAAVESPPLAELLIPTNQDSNNLYAEVLFKTLGVNYPESAVSDASAAGGEAVAAVLEELGVDPATVHLADGSGLSRHNLVTPSALVETLQAMAVHPEAEIFRESLAVAGVRGTLQNRLRDTALAGKLQGKSGALTGNVSLSGYLHPPDYEPLVFSVLINHADHHASVLRDRLDELLLLITQLSDAC